MQEGLSCGENLDEEKSQRREVLEKMKELAYSEAPEPKEDWDLVWVISGPPIDIKEDFSDESKKVLFREGDKIAGRDIADKRNESRERMETGLKIVREVTAKRLGKKAEDVTADDILNNGPNIYWNATDWANDNIREAMEEGFFEEKYKFPSKKIVVAPPDSGIEHTGHQFERFPEELAEASRKIVLVSDIYHLPRVVRYLDVDYSKIPAEKVVVYPSEPRKVPVGKALGETKKIPSYIKKVFCLKRPPKNKIYVTNHWNSRVAERRQVYTI